MPTAAAAPTRHTRAGLTRPVSLAPSHWPSLACVTIVLFLQTRCVIKFRGTDQKMELKVTDDMKVRTVPYARAHAGVRARTQAYWHARTLHTHIRALTEGVREHTQRTRAPSLTAVH